MPMAAQSDREVYCVGRFAVILVRAGKVDLLRSTRPKFPFFAVKALPFGDVHNNLRREDLPPCFLRGAVGDVLAVSL
ncbi:hypothetical protein E5D57_001002 [Metarhizium anisopliae]|nr:hypothetical protein E5D57_001002 [Metarhizium anisopliae]